MRLFSVGRDGGGEGKGCFWYERSAVGRGVSKERLRLSSMVGEGCGGSLVGSGMSGWVGDRLTEGDFAKENTLSVTVTDQLYMV